MPKRAKVEVKPVYPMVHEFKDSMDRALQEAGLLLTSCETLLDLKQVRQAGIPRLQARITALKLALYGDAS